MKLLENEGVMPQESTEGMAEKIKEYLTVEILESHLSHATSMPPSLGQIVRGKILAKQHGLTKN